MLSVSAVRMLIVAYSARKVTSVVNVPAPASSGKTRGTSVASLIGPWFLKISMSRIISSAIRKMMSAPAMANEAMSTWKIFRMASPPKKKRRSNAKEMRVALSALTGRPFCFRLKMIGIAPIISMTANSTMKALMSCWKLNSENISFILLEQRYSFFCYGYSF